MRVIVLGSFHLPQLKKSKPPVFFWTFNAFQVANYYILLLRTDNSNNKKKKNLYSYNHGNIRKMKLHFYFIIPGTFSAMPPVHRCQSWSTATTATALPAESPADQLHQRWQCGLTGVFRWSWTLAVLPCCHLRLQRPPTVPAFQPIPRLANRRITPPRRSHPSPPDTPLAPMVVWPRPWSWSAQWAALS